MFPVYFASRLNYIKYSAPVNSHTACQHCLKLLSLRKGPERGQYAEDESWPRQGEKGTFLLVGAGSKSKTELSPFITQLLLAKLPASCSHPLREVGVTLQTILLYISPHLNRNITTKMTDRPSAWQVSSLASTLTGCVCACVCVFLVPQQNHACRKCGWFEVGQKGHTCLWWRTCRCWHSQSSLASSVPLRTSLPVGRPLGQAACILGMKAEGRSDWSYSSGSENLQEGGSGNVTFCVYHMLHEISFGCFPCHSHPVSLVLADVVVNAEEWLLEKTI